MVLRLIRWFRGYVNFILIGKSPERFINLCSLNGINLWNTKPTSQGLKSCISIFDYKSIRKIAKKSKSRLKIKSKRGLPFFIIKYKGRAGLGIGAVLFICLMFFLSSFVWSVNIIGAENISEQYILKTLAENGLSVGTYKGGMNVQKIQRDMIIAIPEIGWMSINIQDSSANVEIKEKASVPEMNDETDPCNLVAKSDGVITDFEITNGKVEILRGSAVSEGQLLVNSVVEDQMGGVKFTHANGRVYADVIATKTFSMSMKTKVLTPTDNRTKRYSLNFFNFNIPISVSNSGYNISVKQNNSFRIVSEKNTLPFGINEETEIEYEIKDVDLTEEQAKTALLKEMALYEIFCKNESKVKERGFTGGIAESRYTMHVNYVFNENIAQKQKMYVSN